nr:unnamed protein product [uncultured bacterium]
MNEKNDQSHDRPNEKNSDPIGDGIPSERLTEAINRREEKRFRPRGYRAQF